MRVTNRKEPSQAPSIGMCGVPSVGAAASFYELIPSIFDQLVVFDDRLMHAVQPVQGSMDPREGRWVLHGHIREGQIQVQGTLSQAEVETVYYRTLQTIRSRLMDWGPHYHGVSTFRMWVGEDGQVESLEALSDRIIRNSTAGEPPESITAGIIPILQNMTFPASAGSTRIIFPVVVDPAP